MSSSNRPNGATHLSELVDEHQAIVGRIDSDLRPESVWIGAENILQSGGGKGKPPALRVKPDEDPRGTEPITVERIARRLTWKPEEVIFLATRNRIPGAYQVDSEWFFDPRHLRIWYDDVKNGVIRLPH